MLKIVETAAGESGRAQRTVLVTVEADTPDEANSILAKQLAYGERAKLGLPEAGVEYVGGAFPVRAPNQPAGEMKYRRTFKLTQAL